MAEVKPDSTLLSPPPSKKLKQARLPFKVIPTKDVQTVTPIHPSPASGKKRKLSDSASGPSKASKTPRNDENTPKNKSAPVRRIHDAENEVSSSSETDAQIKAKADEKNKDKSRKKNLLVNFVRTTQTGEVSTTDNADSSGIIDLTDVDDCSVSLQAADTKCGENPPKPDIPQEIVTSQTISEQRRNSKEQTEQETAKEDENRTKNTAEADESEKAESTTEKNTLGKSVDISLNESTASLNSKQYTVRNCHVVIKKLSLDKAYIQKFIGRRSLNASTSRARDIDDSANDSMLDSSLDASTARDTSFEEMTSPSSNPSTPASKRRQNSGSARKRPPSAAKSTKDAEKQKRKEEFEKVRLQRLKEKEEKEQQRKEEKEKKEKEREELKKKKEQEKQEKLEQKEKEKQEKLKQKEEEKRKKEEERLQKLEQKKKEMEEKLRQKEEQEKEKQRLKEEKEKEKQRQKEEKEREKQKELEEKNKISNMQKQSFKNFFTKKEKTESSEKVEEVNERFLQFQVKKDTRMAPVRRADKCLKQLDDLLQSQDCEDTYLKELQGKDYARGKSAKTWPDDEDDVICIEDDEQKPSLKRMKVKFLKFHENYRPPYYGTWRKNSKYIGPRKPLGKDTVVLDYEVESDDEWEEEEPGESLSDCEKDKEDENEENGSDEEEDGFFVPHGYLSEGEGCDDDEEENNPEKLKMRQIAKAKRWESEMNAKVAALRTVCIGCVWWNPTEEPRTPEYDALKKYQAVPFTPMPISTVAEISKKDDSKKKKTSESNKEKRKIVPEEAIPDLIRLVHGNQWSIAKILLEFREYWQRKQSGGNLDTLNNSFNTSKPEIAETSLNASKDESPAKEYGLAKVQIKKIIREIANYGPAAGVGLGGNCWMVHKQVLEKHALTDLPIPNQWKWVTDEPKKKRKIPTPIVGQTPEPNSTPTPKDPRENNTPKEASTPDIMKFAVAGISPKFPPKDLKESVNTPSAKECNSPSIMRFTKPGISPKFPTISPKPVKMDTQSPLCSTPKSCSILATKGASNTPKSSSKGSTGTPKRLTTKLLTPSSLFASKPANASIHLEKKENDVQIITEGLKLENPLNSKSDKTESTLMKMFAMKPIVKIIPIEKEQARNAVQVKTDSITVKPTAKIQGRGTEESPMEID